MFLTEQSDHERWIALNIRRSGSNLLAGNPASFSCRALDRSMISMKSGLRLSENALHVGILDRNDDGNRLTALGDHDRPGDYLLRILSQ